MITGELKNKIDGLWDVFAALELQLAVRGKIHL